MKLRKGLLGFRPERFIPKPRVLNPLEPKPAKSCGVAEPPPRGGRIEPAQVFCRIDLFVCIRRFRRFGPVPVQVRHAAGERFLWGMLSLLPCFSSANVCCGRWPALLLVNARGYDPLAPRGLRPLVRTPSWMNECMNTHVHMHFYTSTHISA